MNKYSFTMLFILFFIFQTANAENKGVYAPFDKEKQSIDELYKKGKIDQSIEMALSLLNNTLTKNTYAPEEKLIAYEIYGKTLSVSKRMFQQTLPTMQEYFSLAKKTYNPPHLKLGISAALLGNNYISVDEFEQGISILEYSLTQYQSPETASNDYYFLLTTLGKVYYRVSVRQTPRSNLS